MNCLYLNKDLFRFKLKDNQLCSFCLKDAETIDHIFVKCEFSSNLYSEISSWLNTHKINLPPLNLTSIVVGPCLCFNFSLLINFILLAYKSYIYRARTKGCLLSLNGFKVYLSCYVQIEYNIASKNNTMHIHLTKFSNLRDALVRI